MSSSYAAMAFSKWSVDWNDGQRGLCEHMTRTYSVCLAHFALEGTRDDADFDVHLFLCL